eukprot:g60012.t1
MGRSNQCRPHLFFSCSSSLSPTQTLTIPIFFAFALFRMFDVPKFPTELPCNFRADPLAVVQLLWHGKGYSSSRLMQASWWMNGNRESFMSKPQTRSSTSSTLDTQPAPKKRKREVGEGLDSKDNKNATLLALPLDLWSCIRDYIGWMKLLPLARVCKSLEGLVKTSLIWNGLAESILDLSKFRNSEPLVALSDVWRERTVSFPKVLMAPGTTDSVLKLLSGIGVQHVTLRNCWRITNAGLAHLSALALQHLDLKCCG